MFKLILVAIIYLALGVSSFSSSGFDGQKSRDAQNIDARVRKFLAGSNRSWYGMSVPDADGQALYDLVIQHGYKNALEIGTSVGRSAVWIGWALSKTGGKLITIEIDPNAHEEALANFRETGLANYIDARLADAHKLVPELPGPFDFVFCDADKEWYANYLDAVLPKLTVGGCFAAHNVSESFYRGFGRRGRGGYGRDQSGDFFEYARGIPSLETTILNVPGSAGMSLSYKKAAK
jgi:predicted O-methyltransferase YrrM